MNPNKDREDRFLLTFSDILTIFRKSKKKIFFWAFALGMLGVMFALTRPIRYESDGTFREKSIKPSNISNSLLEFLGSGTGIASGSESEAMSMIKSRKIMKEVVEKLYLQANLEAKSDGEGIFKRIGNNLQIVWNALQKKQKPPLKDICCPLKIDALDYHGEIPVAFEIDLQKNGSYGVRKGKNKIGDGRLGDSFNYDGISWTLAPTSPQQLIVEQSFNLHLDPVATTISNLSKNLTIETSKNDKNIIEITFVHRNRQSACTFINTLMDCFQDYLKNHHRKLALQQMDYLNLRRDHLTKNLSQLMDDHANYLSNDLYSAGFFDTDKEMEFLAKRQHDYKEKLLANELEIKRLENFKPGSVAYYERYSTNEGDPAVINTILADIRKLKQDRDTLEIELQKKSMNQGIDLQHSFEQQLDELKQVQLYLQEIHQLSAQYQAGKLPDLTTKLMNDPRFLLKGWFERLQREDSSPSEHFEKTKESFQFYLVNLERLFGVYQRILQERLTHQQNPSGEYQGISYDVATNLYLGYSKQQIEMEAAIRQNQFFISQIEDPNFEITSLSSGLNDPVSSEMIRKASELVLNLRDQNNQSFREQERIKEDLHLQRTFLTMHLKQMVQLMELNKNLIDEKIFALQNVSLELIHQQISLSEKNLQEYVQSRLYNLFEERELIKRHLEGIYADLAMLPKKWVAEQLIEQEVATNQLIVEEIAKMVESKNISHNLELIQSSPIDLALPSVHPITPKVFLWGLVGLFFGGVLGGAIALGQTVRNGIQASAGNLILMGYHVSGFLTLPLYSRLTNKLPEGNLETLRRIHAYFDPPPSVEHPLQKQAKGKVLLLLEGTGPDYSSDLAELFINKGQRVLILDIDFTGPKTEDTSGLLQYIQGEVARPSILKGMQGNSIKSGGTSAFGSEMLTSPAFRKLIESLKEEYDWIIAKSHSLPCSAEAENLIALFPYAAVTLESEKFEELSYCTWFHEPKPEHQLTFVFVRD